MQVIILKQGQPIRAVPDPKVKSTELGSQEVMTFAKSMSLHPGIDKIWMMTTKSCISAPGWSEKIRPIDISTDLSRFMKDENRVLIFWTSPMNLFGGQVGRTLEESYIKLVQFDGPKFLIGTDTRYLFQDLNEVLRNRKMPVSTEYPTDKFGDLIYMFQSKNIERLKQSIEEAQSPYHKTYKDVVHAPLHLLPLFTHNVDFNPKPKYDFVYTSQAYTVLGKHRKNMIRTYFGKLDTNQFETALIGKDHSVFHGLYKIGIDSMKYDQVKNTLNQARAQLVVSEANYEETVLYPNRIAEGVAANVVNMIHIGVDRDKSLFGSDLLLRDFLYIDTDTDLAYRIEQLKDDTFRKLICDKQRECMMPLRKNMISDIYKILTSK